MIFRKFGLSSFLALGPVPYLPAPSTLPLKVVGLVLQGVGTGCVLVASSASRSTRPLFVRRVTVA